MRARFIPFLAIALAATGCAGHRRAVGDATRAPELAPMEDPRAIYAHQPVMMPEPEPASDYASHPASLWQVGARSFFDDPRAETIGDILTVLISIDDTASINNRTNRNRSSTEDANFNSFLGFEEAIARALPTSVTPSAAVNVNADSTSDGSGAVSRSETVDLTVAAQVTQRLPNGNLVIAGRQEVRINHEIRELLVTGIVRPQDITADNTVAHTKIAEARISYGGRGVISEIQAPRYGQRAWGVVSPF